MHFRMTLHRDSTNRFLKFLEFTIPLPNSRRTEKTPPQRPPTWRWFASVCISSAQRRQTICPVASSIVGKIWDWKVIWESRKRWESIWKLFNNSGQFDVGCLTCCSSNVWPRAILPIYPKALSFTARNHLKARWSHKHPTRKVIARSPWKKTSNEMMGWGGLQVCSSMGEMSVSTEASHMICSFKCLSKSSCAANACPNRYPVQLEKVPQFQFTQK